MGTLHLAIVSPEEQLFSGEVASVTLPGSEGELGLWPGHAPLLVRLNPGKIEYAIDGVVRSLAVGPGFAEASGDRVIVLLRLAEDAGELGGAQGMPPPAP